MRVPVAARVLAAALAALAAIVGFTGSFPGDERALEALNDQFGTDLDDFMVAVGGASDTLPILTAWVIVVAVLVRQGRRRTAVHFLSFVAGAMIGNRLFKEIVRQSRPDVRLSPESVSTFSFPSGHATNALALVVGLLFVLPPGRGRVAVGIVGGLGALLVAFSRLAISVHYPSDVAASVLWVGLLGVLLAPRFSRLPTPTE
ncbi:MAG: phosphatase PAP2 family protein [Acidimicrobiales bacterium]